MSRTKKLLLVGDSGVGKSVFVKCMTHEGFIKGYRPTLGVEAHTILDIDRDIQYEVWDVAGRNNDSMRSAYYINGNIAIIMYDVTCKSTSKSVKKWRKEIECVCPNIPIYVIGNKADLEHKKVLSNNLCSCKAEFSIDNIYSMLNGEEFIPTYNRQPLPIMPNAVKFISHSCGTLAIKEQLDKNICIVLNKYRPTTVEIKQMMKDNIWSPFAMINITIRMELIDSDCSIMTEHYKFEHMHDPQEENVIVNGTLKDWLHFTRYEQYRHKNTLKGVLQSVFPSTDYILDKYMPMR